MGAVGIEIQKKKKKERKIFSFLIPRVSLLLLVLTGVPIVVLCSCCDRHRGASLPTLLFDFFFLCADFSRVSEHFKSQSKGGKKERKTEQNGTAGRKANRQEVIGRCQQQQPTTFVEKIRGASLKIIEKKNFCERVGNRLESCRFFFSFLFFISSVPEFAPIVR